MANSKDDASKGPDRGSGEGSGPKRPFATIDLKATEVRAEPSRPTAAAAAPKAETRPRPDESSQHDAAARVFRAARSLGGTATSADAASATSRAAGVSPASAGTTSQARPAPARAEAREARSGGAGRFASHLAAGLVGGALALVAGPYIANVVGLEPPSSARGAADPRGDAATRLAALEDAFKSRPAGGAASEALTQRMAALEAAAARNGETVRTVQALTQSQAKLAEDAKALGDKVAAQSGSGTPAARIARLEDQLAHMTAAAAAEPDRAGRLPQLAQLTGKIADLEGALETRLNALRKDVAADAEGRLTAAAEASETARSGTQRIDREVAALKSEATRTSSRIDQLKSGGDRLDAAVKSIQEDAAGLRVALDGAKAEIEARFKAAAKPADVTAAIAPLNAKVAALEQSVQGVVSAEADRRTNAERIVLSLELGNLKRTMERGAPYAAELAEVRKVSGGRLDLSAMERHQGDGVPTTADLARAFRPLAGAILDADAEQPDASVVDRLLTGAKSIVRVRKVTHTADDATAEAVVARMEAALKDGRMSDVLAQAKKLSGKAAAPAQDWLRQVEARQAIDGALVAIDQSLKTSLGANPDARKVSKP